MFIPIRMPLDLDLDPFPSTKHFLFPCISLLFMKITSCHSSLNQGSTRTYLGILVLLQEEENRQTDTTRSWVFPCQKERAPGNNFLVMSEHDLVVVKYVFLFVTRPKSSAWFWPSVLLQRFGCVVGCVLVQLVIGSYHGTFGNLLPYFASFIRQVDW